MLEIHNYTMTDNNNNNNNNFLSVFLAGTIKALHIIGRSGSEICFNPV